MIYRDLAFETAELFSAAADMTTPSANMRKILQKDSFDIPAVTVRFGADKPEDYNRAIVS
jgi:hypothetical protein